MRETPYYETVQAAERAIENSDRCHQRLNELLQALESSEGIRPFLHAETPPSAGVSVNPVVSRGPLSAHVPQETGKQVRLYRPVLMRGIII